MTIATEAAALLGRFPATALWQGNLTFAACAAILELETAWGNLAVTRDGTQGFWAEHVSRPEGGGALVRQRWHVTSDGTAHIMALEAGDPRFQGLGPIPS